ncbi:MAG TPA: Fic family protein [Candidatus Norongarragalinales archaeon]|nr:Fic family protein [Candidatus Norongarragalinales archaeon]
MHVEKRRINGRTKYYLAHSRRDGKKILKTRAYLGQDLTEDQVKQQYFEAKTRLNERIRHGKAVTDPFIKNIDPAELQEFKNLATKLPIRVENLTPKDWLKFTEEFTYDTNAIEGSTLAISEVKNIIEKNQWPDKPKEEISETYGVARAIDYLRKTKTHLSVKLILELHLIVFLNSKPFAGLFRPPGVEVVVTDGRGNIVHRGAPAKDVKKRLQELVRWYQDNKKRYPPLVLAAVVHNQFENIHPFQDGNGRVGRLLLNNILLKNGLPPLNIELKNLQEYYASLQAYENRHDLRPTLDLMLKEYRALKKMLKK